MSSAIRIGVVSTEDWEGRPRLDGVCPYTAQENGHHEKGAFLLEATLSSA